MKYVTVKTLEQANACEDQVRLFREIFGERVYISKENIKAALDAGLDVIWFCRNIIQGRWPEAESVIQEDAQWALWYAKNVIHGRWPEAEPVIRKDAKWSYRYAKDIIEG